LNGYSCCYLIDQQYLDCHAGDRYLADHQVTSKIPNPVNAVGAPELERLVRTHANFIEVTPIFWLVY
jgi:hypothetical protein